MWRGVGIFAGLVVAAAAIAPDAAGLALATIGVLVVPVAIVLLTAFMGGARTRAIRADGHEHDGKGPDDASGPE